MYAFLCRYLPCPIVNILMILWYLALLTLIFIYSAKPNISFTYLNL